MSSRDIAVVVGDKLYVSRPGHCQRLAIVRADPRGNMGAKALQSVRFLLLIKNKSHKSLRIYELPTPQIRYTPGLAHRRLAPGQLAPSSQVIIGQEIIRVTFQVV